MPELPDIVVYIENLESRIQGRTLNRVRLLNPFVLRTAIPLRKTSHAPNSRRPNITSVTSNPDRTGAGFMVSRSPVQSPRQRAMILRCISEVPE